MDKDKRIKDLEDLLRRQDAMLMEEQQKVAAMQAGLEEITRITDAVMLRIVQDYGTDVPLGKRLDLERFRVSEILETAELHVTRTEEGLEMTALERKRRDEVEDLLQ